MSVLVVEEGAAAYKPRMEGRQIKAARALLGMSQTDLCKEAGISRATLNDLENDSGDPRRSSIDAVVEAFRKHGIMFTDDGAQIGLFSLRRPRP